VFHILIWGPKPTKDPHGDGNDGTTTASSTSNFIRKLK